MEIVYLNGTFVPRKKAFVSISDRGVRYGDGVFETILIHKGSCYQWPLHKARLQSGLKALHIPLVTKPLKDQAVTLIDQNGVESGILRIMVTRGEGGFGYAPPEKPTPNVIMEIVPRPKPPAAPVTIGISTYRKIPANALPVAQKTMQALNAVLARREAQSHGYFENLMLTQDGHLSESTAGNLFWVKNGELYTPADACDLLLGTTRAAILRLAAMKTHQGAFKPEALKEADEIFLTNTSWGILPIDTVHGLGVHLSRRKKPVTDALHALLEEDKDHDAKRFAR